MSIQDSIRQARIQSDVSLSYTEIKPDEYDSRHNEYFEKASKTFTQKYARYSSDYVDAEVQGLYPDRPFEYTKVHLRFSEAVTASAASSNEYDNYKKVLLCEREFSYLRKGAKIRTMGSTWLVTNPANLSQGSFAMIQRCDAVWHYLDYYGNVMTEPICVGNLLMKANDADSQRSSMITKGYFNCKVQANDATRNLLRTNARIILGSSAYRISGYSDFIQEFTDDEDSVNMLEFALRYEEPNDALDDMDIKVAGAKVFQWDVDVSGISSVNAGTTHSFTATSIRNGEVQDGTEMPVSYTWESSDTSVATVDANGNVTGVAAGTATISATLVQNPDRYAEMEVEVTNVLTAPHIAFDTVFPTELSLYEQIEVNARYVDNGVPTADTVVWSIGGKVSKDKYTYSVSGNKITIKCFGGSVVPITITAGYNGITESGNIYLKGI